MKWLSSTRSVLPLGVAISYSAQSRLKIGPSSSASVATVDQHDLAERRAIDLRNDVLVEPDQARAILGLYHALHVGVHGVDDARRVVDRGRVDRLALQLEPADPVVPSGHPDLGRLVLGLDDQMSAARLPQPDQLAGSVCDQARILLHDLEQLLLDRGSVRGFLDQVVQPRHVVEGPLAVLPRR
ncbi:MAG: hypothetical protein E6J90_16660 [Deltaproteobacteria bacterium]|nr:MAG: hypothetical protein E6J90_16660 [Deltaproteobacteria bacterium]